MIVNQLFESIERTLLAKFNQSSFIHHNGDKGENREEFLITFLREHLPQRYGVTKGEVITKEGKRSHAIDIIIYDTVNCPVLYAGKTSILPIEGVYGIIEVKSTLSKTEFIDASSKIKSFKELAPRSLGVRANSERVTVLRGSRPFGIVFGFKLADNSLHSLSQNWLEQSKEVFHANFFCNMVCVLGKGVLRFENVNLTKGEKHLLLDTDEFVKIFETRDKKIRNNELLEELVQRIVVEDAEDRAFGRFFTYLLIMLNRMKLNTPDLAQYIDPDLGLSVVME